MSASLSARPAPDPASALGFVPDFRLGIDLGGTKIEIIALGPDGTERLRKRVPTPQGDYAGTVRAIAALVADSEGALGGRGSVGVGIPGAISPATGLVKNANSTALIGHPLDRDLAAALGRPVRVANDANCFAMSEATDGAGAGAEVVFGVILGTGCGGGIVVHGRVLTGPNAIAGEWGHNPLPWAGADEMPGRRCYCGRVGCIETWLSGPGLAADYAGSAELPRGRAADAGLVAEHAAAGDADARAALDRHADRLARALAAIINVIDPDVIVLGGGLSKLDHLYEQVPRLWLPWIFTDRCATRLRRNRHGDSSGVRGAAWLWPPAGRTAARD
ncbi:MAG: ROK family protein [Alphaproteobacteria bacterium]|nr:ROK family protein [Alphaproteobacteria bacterium]